MNAPGGKRAVSDEESLAALRSTWHACYVIPEPRRRLMWWRTWTAWRRDASSLPFTARDAAALGLAIAEDWTRQTPLERARRGGAR